MRKCLLLLTATSVSADRMSWVYSWPTLTGQCTCKSIPLEGVLGGHATQEECEKAFANEPGEYCSYKDFGGISEHDCSDAVSKVESMRNMDCENECISVVVGNESLDKFLQNCSLQPVVAIGSTLAAPSCFSNYVIGFADPAIGGNRLVRPLKVFREVDSAALCQSMCQQIKGCVWFQWRGIDDLNLTDAFLGTCSVFDQHYIDLVLAQDPTKLDVNSNVCDSATFKKECDGIFSKLEWNPFNQPECLSCDCTVRCGWVTGTHISGPAYCSDNPFNLCQLPTPTPHTTSLECVTETCVPDSTTATMLNTEIGDRSTTSLITSSESTTALLTTKGDTITTLQTSMGKASSTTDATPDKMNFSTTRGSTPHGVSTTILTRSRPPTQPKFSSLSRRSTLRYRPPTQPKLSSHSRSSTTIN